MIFVMLGALILACSFFAGYEMAIRRRLNVLPSVAFAAVSSATAYVIIDLEYPRLARHPHRCDHTLRDGFPNLTETAPLVFEIPAGAMAGGIMDFWERPMTDCGQTGPDKGRAASSSSSARMIPR